MDAGIDILSYRVEIKICNDIYRDLPVSEILEQYKHEVSPVWGESFRYRLIASNIMCIVSTWEQQLFDYCNKHIAIIDDDYRIIKNKFLGKFGTIPDLFKDIDEFRYVENVLKHGKSGNSYKQLVKADSKFLLENDDFKNLAKYGGFNMPVLNINKNTVFDLCDKIELFWKNINSFIENEH